MRGLSESGSFIPYEPKGKKLSRKGVQEVWTKLIKVASLKGKYKYREKFNFMHSPQLKAIHYKKK